MTELDPSRRPEAGELLEENIFKKYIQNFDKKMLDQRYSIHDEDHKSKLAFKVIDSKDNNKM